MKYHNLLNRGVISISGNDIRKLLQGIITTDINKVTNNKLTYSLMLSPQGKLLYDFFLIFQDDNTILLDCYKDFIHSIIEKFEFYKLRSKVKIENVTNKFKIIISSEKIFDNFFIDPRNEKLGYRSISELKFLEQSERELGIYNNNRISLLIPDGGIDFMPGDYFPIDLRMDKILAIDFTKGCYVGQEVTARMHYGVGSRKTLYSFFDQRTLRYGEEIISEEGKILVKVLGGYKNNYLGISKNKIA